MMTTLCSYHVLMITEEDFKSLKSQQGLLVDFDHFPSQLVRLLEQCYNANDNSASRFLLILEEEERESVLDGRRTCLKIVETNNFKPLVHLSLKIGGGSDAEIKKFMAFNIKQLKLANALVVLSSTAEDGEIEVQLDWQKKLETEKQELEERHSHVTKELENQINNLKLQNQVLFEKQCHSDSVNRHKTAAGEVRQKTTVGEVSHKTAAGEVRHETAAGEVRQKLLSVRLDTKLLLVRLDTKLLLVRLDMKLLLVRLDTKLLLVGLDTKLLLVRLDKKLLSVRLDTKLLLVRLDMKLLLVRLDTKLLLVRLDMKLLLVRLDKKLLSVRLDTKLLLVRLDMKLLLVRLDKKLLLVRLDTKLLLVRLDTKLLLVRLDTKLLVREQSKQLELLEKELNQIQRECASLRKQNVKLDTDYHEKEKIVNNLNTRTAVLEQLVYHLVWLIENRELLTELTLAIYSIPTDFQAQQKMEVKDKVILLNKQQELLRSANQQKAHLEESLAEKDRSLQRKQVSLRSLSDELVKANEILTKLQAELTSTNSKLKLRTSIALEQEHLLDTKQKELYMLQVQCNEQTERIKHLEAQEKQLSEALQDANTKLQDKDKLLKNNDNVINWLNRRLNESQSQFNPSQRGGPMLGIGPAASTPLGGLPPPTASAVAKNIQTYLRSRVEPFSQGSNLAAGTGPTSFTAMTSNSASVGTNSNTVTMAATRAALLETKQAKLGVKENPVNSNRGSEKLTQDIRSKSSGVKSAPLSFGTAARRDPLSAHHAIPSAYFPKPAPS
ncbi:unnamed protein product [Timema podura]|uniref:Spindle assembly abnormal protein 6 N-terminal domain-containing protein n=1 Tax=Timema podura TaxID=61482 RepID=A0ABN7NMX0_TIMPD|nr:unnamed protein product [Timema podura]